MLRELKRDKSDAGKKAVAKRATAYSVLHPTGQTEHEPPILNLDMDDIIVDPLHCLFLNLPKTLWKYCFGDRMTNSQREAVAEYLSEIGCALDIRAKGDGRDAGRKWFTGAIFQRFVEGGQDDNIGGLKRNIENIVDIIFKHHPADAPAIDHAPAAAPSPAPTDVPAPKPQRAPRARTRKRVGGFCAVDDAEEEPDDNTGTGLPPAPAPAATGTSPTPTPEDLETASLRARYASNMDVVALI